MRVIQPLVPFEAERVWRNPYYLSAVPQLRVPPPNIALSAASLCRRTEAYPSIVQSAERVRSNLCADRAAHLCLEGYYFLVLVCHPLKHGPNAVFEVFGNL